MAITVTLEKIVPNILLNDGTTETGSVKTKTVKPGGSSQSISTSAYNSNITESRQKLVNILTVLAPCFSKTVYKVQEIQTSALSEA